VQVLVESGPGPRDANRHTGNRAVIPVPLEGFLVPQQATGRSRTPRESSIGKLARFFPDATPVRIPVQLTLTAGGNAASESTLIEFGTSREVLFASTLPLEFADLLRMKNSDGTLNTEVCVVAVQYDHGRTAVAARFTEEVPNWIVKP